MAEEYYFEESGETVLLGTSNDSVVLAEPFTWAWVGLKLAEGVVAWAGGKVAESLFFSEPKVSDLIEEAVKELKRFVAEELERREIDIIKADLRSSTRLLGEWINAPRHSRDRVTLAHENSVRSYERLSVKGLPACTIFSDAVSIHLHVLLARYYSFGEKGELKNINALIGEAEQKLLSHWIEPHVRSLEAFRDSIFYVGVGMTPGRPGNPRVDDPGIPPVYFGRYSVGGAERSTEPRGDSSDDKRRAEDDARAMVANLRSQTQQSIDGFSASIRDPIIKRIAEWKRAAELIRRKRGWLTPA